MSRKIKHRLIVPGTASVIQTGILRIIVRRIAARPAASVFFPEGCVIRIGISDRNPGAFPVKDAERSRLIRRCTDVADHRRLALHRRRISVHQILRAGKTICKAVAVLCRIAVGCLCDIDIFSVGVLNIFCNCLHIFHRSIPVRIIGQTEQIVIHAGILQIGSPGVHFLVILNIGIMNGNLDIFSVILCNLTHRTASRCNQIHDRIDILLACHAVVDLVADLHHSDIDTRV